jgi:hypothetical protein
VPETRNQFIKKRVVLQEAYDQGRSIFSFHPPTSSKAEDCAELRRLYTDLAHFIVTRIGKEGKEG